MEQNDTPAIGKVYGAVAAVSDDLAKIGISKDSRNEAQKFKYRGIDAVYNTLGPLLAKHRLIIAPKLLGISNEEKIKPDGKALFYTRVTVEYVFISAEDGSTFSAVFPGEAMDSSDKATNKAMTAAYKYLVFQIFCIPISPEEGSAMDADNDTHDVRGKVKVEPDLSPVDFINAIHTAKDEKDLRGWFADAWRGYDEKSWREKFKAAYDKRAAELASPQEDK